jgi:hypothetical protein
MTTPNPETLKQLKQNPTLFAETALNFKPFSYQEKLLNDPAQRIIACMGRQTGKTSVHVAGVLERLGGLGFDAALLAGVRYGERVVSEVGRETILALLEALSRRDAGVRRRLVGLRSVYPKHEEFVAKVAELDVAGLAKALKRLSFMAQSKVYLFWRKTEIC